MRYCTCPEHQASRSRARATLFLIVVACLLLLYVGGCTTATDQEVKGSAAQLQAQVDRLNATLAAATTQPATQPSARVQQAKAALAAASKVLQDVQDHPDQAPDLSPLYAVTAPIPYGGLAVAAGGLLYGLFHANRRARDKQALEETTRDLQEHQTALAEIVPAVDDLRKAVPAESASLWKQQVLADYSDSTKALVAANKG